MCLLPEYACFWSRDDPCALHRMPLAVARGVASSHGWVSLRALHANGTPVQSLGSVGITISSVRDVSVALEKLFALLKYAHCSGVRASRQC